VDPQLKGILRFPESDAQRDQRRAKLPTSYRYKDSYGSRRQGSGHGNAPRRRREARGARVAPLDARLQHALLRVPKVTAKALPDRHDRAR
jgi:hypothetical protein